MQELEGKFRSIMQASGGKEAVRPGYWRVSLEVWGSPVPGGPKAVMAVMAGESGEWGQDMLGENDVRITLSNQCFLTAHGPSPTCCCCCVIVPCTYVCCAH